MIKKSLSEIIKETEGCFPTIFTKEDVLLVLNSIETEVFIPDEEKIQELKSELLNAIQRMDSDKAIDYDSAEFGIQSGNEIILEDASLDFNNIEDVINETVDDFFGA